MNKGREWNIPLCTLISSNNPVTPYGEVVHVIEYQAYKKVLESLKALVNIPEAYLIALETLKELGEHE